jgi:plastocyanin
MHRSDRRRTGFPFRSLATLLLVALPLTAALARPFTVAVADRDGAPLAGVAVYLAAVDPDAVLARPVAPATMDQMDLKFVPRLLVVQRGAEVDFPNSDLVGHHVYSFSAPKAFELPLYKGQKHSPVRFEQPGVVILGCNIHDRMVAYILVVDTPYFAISDATGQAVVDGPPPGDYRLAAWSPEFNDSLPEMLGRLSMGPALESVSMRIDRLRSAPPAAGNSSLVWGEY